jgi:hypothetical protein
MSLKSTNPTESRKKTQTPVENSQGNTNAGEIRQKTPTPNDTPPGSANINWVDPVGFFYWASA